MSNYKKYQRIITAPFVFAGICMLAVPALAQTNTAAADALRQACAADVQTLCPGVQPGDGRIKACFKDNRDKLSDGCKQALMSARRAKQSSNSDGQ